MPPSLERLLAKLQGAPLDRALDGVAGDVAQRLAETQAMNAETWRLRAVAVLLVGLAGVVASGSTVAVAAPESSPFSAWSTLAPSTLLEPVG